MKNAPTNSKSCTYCGANGHTSRTCVVKKAGMPSPVAAAKEQAKLAKIAEREAAAAAKAAAKAEKIAAREAAKAEKARIKDESRSWRARRQRCTYCGGQGHSRRGCKEMKADPAKIIAILRATRTAYWNAVKDMELAVGTLVSIRGWAHYTRLGDPRRSTVWNRKYAADAEMQIVTRVKLQSDMAHPVILIAQPMCAIGTNDGENEVPLPIMRAYHSDQFISDIQRWYTADEDTGPHVENDWNDAHKPVSSGAKIGDFVDAKEFADWMNPDDAVRDYFNNEVTRTNRRRGWGRRAASSGDAYSHFGIRELSRIRSDIHGQND